MAIQAAINDAPYPWQQEQWKLLIDNLHRDHLAHAILLKGSAGMGKQAFSQALAKKVLCEQQAEQACGQCRSCELFSLANHSDFYQVTLEEKAKAIKVDQIRTLISSLQKTAQHNGYQVAIINPADKMNRAAANALLKTLEEPSGRVLLVLVADQTATLPATILSRCQAINFSLKEESVALTWLQKSLQQADSAKTLLKLAEGAPLRALAIESENYLAMRDELLTFLWRLQRKQIGPIALVSEWLKKDLQIILRALTTIVMDLLRVSLAVNQQHLTNIDCYQKLQALAKPLDPQALSKYMPELMRALQLLTSSANVNVQLLLENLLLKWQEVVLC